MKKSIFLFFAAILCAMSINAADLTGGTVLYLKPNSNWASNNAWFAMYLCNGSSAAEWVKMTLAEGETNVYTATVPAGKTHKNVIFCRMNKANTTKLDWSNKWNQSGDLTWDGTKNCCAIKDGQWDCGTNVTWSTYTPKVTHTFAKNSTLYVDFRAITGAKKGANYPKAGSVGIDYSANAGGTVIPVTFTSDVKWTEGTEFIKTDQGGWASIPFKAPSAGQNCAQVAADGKSYTWTTYTPAAPEPDPVYTVVGSSAELGLEWNPANEANDMEKQGDGSYKKVYSNVELTSDVEWKIAKNDDWWDGPTFNQSNNTLTIAQSGIYNVTFTLSADLATATATADLIEATNTVADCFISGNAALTGGAGWAGNEFKMEYDPATETYSYTLTGLAASTAYEIKVVCGGVWYSFDKLVDPAPANVTEGNDHSIAFQLAEAGDVTVTYHATNGINLTGSFVLAPLTYTVTVPAGTAKCYICGAWDWNTFMEMNPTANANEFTIDIVGATTGQEYKYTCGEGWEYAEVNADGSTRANRTYNANDVVEKWADVITYVLMGVNGDWTTGITMTVNPDNADEYVLTDQVIIKATDAVKVVTLTNGTATAWCGNVDTWSNATYTADGDGNIVLEDGIYTFYFKKSTDNIYINQTGYARNVTNTYGTICLPYASASTSGATFYEVVGQEAGSKVYLGSVNTLAAGVPYIFEKSANQIKVVYTGEKASTASSANGLVGTFTEITVPDGDYILYNNAFCTNESAGTPNKIKENRAYLDMDAVTGGKPTQMPGRRYIGMGVQGENEATGFENITAPEGETKKVLINGQLIIIRGGEKFNAQGVRF